MAGLTIPQLSLPVATVVSTSEEMGAESPSAALCAELLRMGILEESDWAGTFVETLHQGLKRWVNEVKGARTWSVLDAHEVYLSDDCLRSGAPGDWASDWRKRFSGDADRPVGMLGLCTSRHTGRGMGDIAQVWCREGVLALEGLHPGAGFSVLNLLSWALEFTTPAITFNHVGVCLGAEPGRASMPEECGMTLDMLEEYIPRGAWHYRMHREDVFGALDAIGGRGGRLAVALNAAIRLDDMVREVERRWSWLSHLRVMERPEHGGHGAVGYPSAVFRWHEDDIMPRAADTILEADAGADLLSTRAWVHGFQLGHAGVVIEDQFANRRAGYGTEWLYPAKSRIPDGGVRSAFEALSLTLDIMGQCDEIMRCIG